MSFLVNELIQQLEQSYEEHADVECAHFMSKYMRDQFAFYGIQTPQRRRLQYLCLQQITSLSQLTNIIQFCYAKPQREWQYFACDLTANLLLTKEFIQTIEFMITQKSWWDTVDTIASKIVGQLVRDNPILIKKMDKWIDSENFWLQRSAILYQLRYKQATDADRLFSYCTQLADSKEFFIQKAIGWALREYSKTDAAAVQQFVATQSLAKLSQREALKWLHTHT